MMRKNRLKQIVAIAFIMAGAAKISMAQPIEETNPGSTHGDLGTVKFNYGGSEVTYTTVRAKDGNVWLQQNLGSSRVATGRVDAQSFGDLFQWGRWDDGHHLRTGGTLSDTPPDPNNPSGLDKTGTNQPFYHHATTAANRWWAAGVATDKAEASDPEDVTATNGCDPCKKIMGGDWRLPTQAEWDALRTVEEITNADAAFASLLKIPSANPRFGDSGNLQGNNNTTRLWSSTAGSGGGAFVLNFTLTAASTLNIARTTGFPVRCINKPVTTPVELIGFKGKSGLKGVELEWTVSSEHNNAYYTVKHSGDGAFFKNLKDISGRENSSVRQSYTYLHSNPVTGANYYRLSQTDLDGTERELSTISVTGTSLGEATIIINATDQSVKVELAGFESQPNKIIISSISGQKIYEGRIADNSVELPLALQKGVYVARVDFEDNTSKTVKFIK